MTKYFKVEVRRFQIYMEIFIKTNDAKCYFLRRDEMAKKSHKTKKANLKTSRKKSRNCKKLINFQNELNFYLKISKKKYQ